MKSGKVERSIGVWRNKGRENKGVEVVRATERKRRWVEGDGGAKGGREREGDRLI